MQAENRYPVRHAVCISARVVVDTYRVFAHACAGLQVTVFNLAPGKAAACRSSGCEHVFKRPRLELLSADSLLVDFVIGSRLTAAGTSLYVPRSAAHPRSVP